MRSHQIFFLGLAVLAVQTPLMFLPLAAPRWGFKSEFHPSLSTFLLLSSSSSVSRCHPVMSAYPRLASVLLENTLSVCGSCPALCEHFAFGFELRYHTEMVYRYFPVGFLCVYVISR